MITAGASSRRRKPEVPDAESQASRACLVPWYELTAQSILVVAPHPDDEVIGCGGLLCLHAQIGGQATIAYLTAAEQHRRQEASAARSHLAVTRSVELNFPEGHVQVTDQSAQGVNELLGNLKPNTLMLPSIGDRHPDHRAANNIFFDALSQARNGIKEILFYEGFTPICYANAWLDISQVAERKWTALTLYQSQQERYRIVEIAQHLNAFRALTTMRKHVRYAEAFRRLTVSEYLDAGWFDDSGPDMSGSKTTAEK